MSSDGSLRDVVVVSSLGAVHSYVFGEMSKLEEVTFDTFIF